MSIVGGVLYAVKFPLGYAFTSDPNIIARVKKLAPLVAIVQPINGIQGVSQGVLRGMCRHSELFAYTLLSYWMVGMPLGLYLAFFTRPRYGIDGIWYGFIVALGLLSSLLLFIILTTDWEREVRRARVRAEKYQNSFETIQATPRPGGRGLGGFVLLNPTGEEELDELERVEIILAEEKNVSGESKEAPSRNDVNDDDDYL